MWIHHRHGRSEVFCTDVGCDSTDYRSERACVLNGDEADGLNGDEVDGLSGDEVDGLNGALVRFWAAGSTVEGNANPRRKSSHSQPITSVEIFGNDRVERYSVDGGAEGYVRFDLRRPAPRHLKRVRGLPPSISAS